MLGVCTSIISHSSPEILNHIDVLRMLMPTSLYDEGVQQLLTQRTSRRFLQCRLTPDMERKINFLTSQVKFGNQKRYQDWFQKQVGIPRAEYGARTPTDVFAATLFVIRLPKDVIEVSCCCLPQSWWWHSGKSGDSRCLFCCRSLSGLTVSCGLSGQKSGRCGTRVRSHFLSELPQPAAGVVTSDRITRLLPYRYFVATLGSLSMHGQFRSTRHLQTSLHLPIPGVGTVHAQKPDSR